MKKREIDIDAKVIDVLEMDIFQNINRGLFSKVKEVVEITDLRELEKLRREGWILLSIFTNSGKVNFSLGRIN